MNLKLWVKVQKNWRDSDYLMEKISDTERTSNINAAVIASEKFSIMKNGTFLYSMTFFSVGETILKDHGRRGGTDERRILGIIYDIRKD